MNRSESIGLENHAMSARKENLPTVSLREFARIVGVDVAAVSRAAKSGQRLTTASVMRDESGTPSIVLAIGCFEWISNKDHRKDREPLEEMDPGRIDPNEIMETAKSLKIQRHFDALASMTNFLKEAGELVPKDAHRTEVITYARGIRDALLYIPNSSEIEARRHLVTFVRKHLGEEEVSTLSKDLDEICLAMRVYLRNEITKALQILSEENIKLAKGKMEKNRVGSSTPHLR
jgi:hypothetical protein